MSKSIQLLTAYKSIFDKFVLSYPEGFVPVDTAFPYATYTVESSVDLEEGLIQYRIYTKSSSFKELCTIIDRVEQFIEEGGNHSIGYGTVKLYKGDPFFQLVAEEDKTIKSAYLNINYTKIQIKE